MKWTSERRARRIRRKIVKRTRRRLQTRAKLDAIRWEEILRARED